MEKKICPAYAGMILDPSRIADHNKDLSRVCGDDPGRFSRDRKGS